MKMKKLLLSLMTVAAFGFANAQIKEKGTIEITPKIGYSSFAEVTNSGRTDAITGLALAATADYYFNNRWSLRSGFSLDKMGSKSVVSGRNYEDKLNYFSVPVNVNWHFGSTRKWNLNFGITSSYLTSAKIVENGIQKDFQKEAIKSIQYGLSYGIGYKIEITKKFGVLIDAQFFSGLTDINNTLYLPGSYKNAGGSYNVGAVIQL
jgi:hypothetical protein